MTDTFEAKIAKQVEQLTRRPYREIEGEVAQKRVAWLRQYRPAAGDLARLSPRQAFELLFFDYMGLAPAELPVIEETPAKIVWRSLNPCPTLEAARRLKLDTRQICRAIYEKSTQAFLSQLDPQLRFLRSYEEIRPYAECCQEWIVRLDFAELMRLALEEARKPGAARPRAGSVIVLGEQILARAGAAGAEQEPGLHAEAGAIRQAQQASRDENLCGAILFTTREPCPVCSSLAASANLTTIVYGASCAETARPGESLLCPGASETGGGPLAGVEVIGGVLKDECRSLDS